VSPRDRSRLYHAAILAPVERIADTPAWAKAWAITAAVPALLGRADLFVLVWFVLLGASAMDYVIGSTRASIEGRHDEDISRAKLLGKAISLVAVVLLRLTEALLLKGGIDTGGAAAVGVSALLLLDELNSLNRHKSEVTGKPIPGLGQLLDTMKLLVGRWLPQGEPAAPPPAPEPEP
jgi:hypothetical protein